MIVVSMQTDSRLAASRKYISTHKINLWQRWNALSIIFTIMDQYRKICGWRYVLSIKNNQNTFKIESDSLKCTEDSNVLLLVDFDFKSHQAILYVKQHE